MGVEEGKLAALAIDNPYKSVEIDVAALKANPNLAADVQVTGLVYDVTTGKVETVVRTSRLRC